MTMQAHKAVFTAPPAQTPANGAVDGPLMGNGDALVALGGAPERLTFHIGKNDLWVMRSDRNSHPVPLALLALGLPALQGASYRVEQDLPTAVTAGRFEKDGRALTVAVYVAATENLMVMKLGAEGGGFQGRAELTLPGEPASGAPGEVDGCIGRHGDTQFAERRCEQGVMTPAGAACAVRVLGGGEQFTVLPEKPVFIVASVCSCFDRPGAGRSEAADFRAAAVGRVAGIRSADDLGPLLAAHKEWWRRFWSQSFVEIPDKVLEQRYYLSHYVLASASRVYDFPPGLFGWVTTDKPSWHGDYHLNYNFVAPFYGLCAANHVEQADPCCAPILAARTLGHEWSARECGIPDGVLLPVGIGPKGSTAFALLLDQKSNGAYSCVPIAERWFLTYDLDFAAKAYPFVRDTAVFWEKWLKFEGGRYNIYKDAIHERSGDDLNPVLTLGLVKMVMHLALDMSAGLDADADRRALWTHILDHLAPYPECTVRDLPEKFLPKHMPHTDETLSLPIFRYTEKGTAWWEDNTLGIQHIYPAGGLGLDSSPELLMRARNQIAVLHRWVDFNGMNSFYAAAARVGCDPVVILGQMRGMLDKLAFPNGMIRGNPHGMEHQSIVPNAIQEMLMQSHEGVIRLFPCWPADQDASFGALRARGAFLVSAELRNGRVRNVRIVSERGRACTVQNPWPGRVMRVERSGKPAGTVAGERPTLETAAGETIMLNPA